MNLFMAILHLWSEINLIHELITQGPILSLMEIYSV